LKYIKGVLGKCLVIVGSQVGSINQSLT